MGIEAVTSPGLYFQHTAGLGKGRQKADVLEPLTSDGETQQSNLNSKGPVKDADKNTESCKGVLNLIQEGHFKGVADVRLRINFADELAAIEQNRTTQDVNQKVDGIVEAVTSALTSAPLNEPLFDSYIDPFEQAINKSKEDYLSAENQSESILIDGLNAAVENLVASLTQALTSNTTENHEEGNVPVDGGTYEATPVSDLISELRAIVSTGMDDLTQALTGVNILPELSGPNGNGVAYEKFLAIYNEMNASPEPVDTASNIDHLDTSV